MSSASFDPHNVNLSTANPADVVCYLSSSSSGYNGHFGARISSIFVILACSTFGTVFPYISRRVPSLNVPIWVYIFARYFGTGVILATGFVHLLDPSYSEIGPNSCVGMTGNWAIYSWPPAIAMGTVVLTFLVDFGAEIYVEDKYGISRCDVDKAAVPQETQGHLHRHTETGLRGKEHDLPVHNNASGARNSPAGWDDLSDVDSVAADKSFKQQIAAFLVLEFGVLFHSVIIGLSLGVAGKEFSTLYPVIIFHQTFEGLGIGARMSAIPFKPGSWLPWLLTIAYGLTTPIAIALGLAFRHTYNPNSNVANIVSGILDAMSGGILIWTALVELMARDFLFDPNRTKNKKQLLFMLFSMLAGAGLMALLGKWA